MKNLRCQIPDLQIPPDQALPTKAKPLNLAD